MISSVRSGSANEERIFEHLFCTREQYVKLIRLFKKVFTLSWSRVALATMEKRQIQLCKTVLGSNF